MHVSTFAREECDREGGSVSDMMAAITFLSSVPSDVSEMELEMFIMHAAYVVDNRNEFVDNFNVKQRGDFIDLVDTLKSTDVAAWTKQLGHRGFWDNGNLRVANLVYNWINGTLDNPERIV